MIVCERLRGSRPARSMPASEGDSAVLARRRAEMVSKIAAEVRALRDSLGRASLDARVMAAMERVPRHAFVPVNQQSAAYENRPLAIGYGQTISQPLIVALMTDLLCLEAGANVLEIGTGSGYQAAVLAELGAQVHSIEVVDALAVDAQHRLSALGYRNVSVQVGDGHRGWAEHAPYDGIIITAACDDVPPALLVQLKTGGRLVAPIRDGLGGQWLTLVEKDPQGRTKRTAVLGVAFVPLVGSSG